MELAATARDQSTVNEFIQEQTRQVLVRYGRMKASAAELINIKCKYQVQVQVYWTEYLNSRFAQPQACHLKNSRELIYSLLWIEGHGPTVIVVFG